MFGDLPRGPLATMAALALLAAAPLRAQAPGSEERPRVERLTFRGVESVDAAELRRSIATRQTRCRSVLLRPFCWLTDWSVFVEKHYLEPLELPRDELRIEVFYFQRGYRDAVVAAGVQPRGRGVEVVFAVDEGEPTRIESLALRQTEEVLRGRHLRRAGLPEAGEPLDLVRLDTARLALERMLGERGYLDARVRDSVAVAADGRRAWVELWIEPGRRATVGGIDVEGNRRVEESTIRRALTVREGRVLRRGDIEAARRTLYESNLFHEVLVEVPPQPDSAKRIRIAVREAPQRGARVGGGFNTVDFVQTEGRLTHYNWLGGGRRLQLQATVGNLFAEQLNGTAIFRDVLPEGFGGEDERAFLRPTWQASLEFLQPSFRAAENTVGLNLFAHRRSVPGIVIDRGYGASASFTRRLRPRSPVTLEYRHEVASVEAGDLYFCVNYGICDPPTIAALRSRQRLAPLGLSFFSDYSDGPLAPTRGYTARLDVEHASGVTLSDFRYHRVSAEATYYHPLGQGRRRVLAGRLRGGWVAPLESTAPALGVGPAEERESLLHPRKRFYAGGARSVRGYGENQLGPRILTVAPEALLDTGNGGCTPAELADGSCDPNHAPADAFEPRPLGGRTVLEANLEYRFPVWRQLGGAVFVDGGLVAGPGERVFAEGRSAVTPGFGIRYQSPVGPIRADLGFRPRLAETLPVVTELRDADGGRRIVRLQTPRRWDPLEDRDALWRQLLGRLTLHLSIGQAF